MNMEHIYDQQLPCNVIEAKKRLRFIVAQQNGQLVLKINQN
jgi:hypothetical protein